MKSSDIDPRWVPAAGMKITMTAPAGEEDHVGSLDVVRVRPATGPEHRSFWQPDADELAILNRGGYIILAICSGAHPPVRVGTWDAATGDPIETAPCDCGNTSYRPFGEFDLMCLACGALYTLKPEVREEIKGVAAEADAVAESLPLIPRDPEAGPGVDG